MATTYLPSDDRIRRFQRRLALVIAIVCGLVACVLVLQGALELRERAGTEEVTGTVIARVDEPPRAWITDLLGQHTGVYVRYEFTRGGVARSGSDFLVSAGPADARTTRSVPIQAGTPVRVRVASGSTGASHLARPLMSPLLSGGLLALLAAYLASEARHPKFPLRSDDVRRDTRGNE